MRRVLALALLLAGCAGQSLEEPSTRLDWHPERGLEVTLGEAVAAGSGLEIGQTGELGGAVIEDWVTVGAEPFFAATEDGRGAGYVVTTLPAPSDLPSGTVLRHRLLRQDFSGLVQPSEAWFAVDGEELARRSW